MPPLYTHYAANSIRFAQARAAEAGDIRVPPEYLLLGLLLEPDSWASVLLEGMGISLRELAAVLEAQDTSSEGVHYHAAVPLSRNILEAVNRAGNEAHGSERPRVGTDHLLLVIAWEGRGAAAQLLAERGASYQALHEEVKRLRQAQVAGTGPAIGAGDVVGDAPWASSGAHPQVPVAVTGTALLMGLHAVFGILLLIIMMPYGFGVDSWATVFPTLGFVWATCCCCLMIAPLLAGRRWAWSAVQALFSVKTTAFLAVLAWMAPHLASAGDVGIIFAIAAVLLVLLAVGLFQARTWFGVEPRRGWRTLMREGWWALVVTAVFDFGTLMHAVLLSAQ